MLGRWLLVAMLFVSENVYAQFGIYVPDRPKVSLVVSAHHGKTIEVHV